MNEWDLKSLFWHSNFSNILLKVGWKLIYKSSIFPRLKTCRLFKRVHNFKTTWEAPFRHLSSVNWISRTHEYSFDMASMMQAQYPSKCLLGPYKVKSKGGQQLSEEQAKKLHYSVSTYTVTVNSRAEQKKKFAMLSSSWVLHLFFLGFKLRFRIIFNLSQVMLLEGSFCKWSWRSQKCQKLNERLFYEKSMREFYSR